MRRVSIFCALVVAGCGGASSSPVVPAPNPASTTPIVSTSTSATSATPTLAPLDTTLIRTLATTRGFRLGTPIGATPTPDGKGLVFLRSGAREAKQSLFELDLATGATKTLASPDDVSKAPETLSPEEKIRRERLRISASGFTDFEISHDGKHVLVTLSGRLFVVDRTGGATRELPTPKASAAFDPHLSPDGTRVAYVRDHDVRVMSLDAKTEADEITVTTGGKEDAPHGEAEFVAQEELDRARGFWWSPDSTSIAYEAYDASKVELLTIVDPAHPESAQSIRYPRAGTTNATVKLAVVAVPKKGLAQKNGHFVTWDETLPYLVSVHWDEHGPLSLVVMSRDQRDAQLLSVDDKTGKTTVLLREHDDAWLDVDTETPRFLADGSFLWSAVRDDTWGIELHDGKGALVRRITPTDMEARRLIDVDEAKKTIRFLGSWQPDESTLFEESFASPNAKPNALTPSTTYVQRARWSHDHSAYFVQSSTLEGARSFTAVGAKTVDVPSVAESPPPLRPVELAHVGADAMRVAVVRPHGFDPKRKYPVIDAAYGGPGVDVVTRDGLAYVRAQWLADATNAVVVCIDAKGTPYRGRAWERAIGKAFGRVPLEGHVAALRALAATHPEIDLSRVGVFGWSFGGYFSALAVLRAPDFYTVAVAGAPVTDWRDYDTTYTERYMGTPQADAKAYDDASLLTWALRPVTNDAPARPLLVMHGTADDNVFFLHSLKLVDALEKSGRPFEFLPLEGLTHQLASPQMAEVVWTKTASFLRDHL